MYQVKEYASKDGKNWVLVAEWYERPGEIVILGEDYSRLKEWLVQSGYRYFKREVEEIPNPLQEWLEKEFYGRWPPEWRTKALKS